MPKSPQARRATEPPSQGRASVVRFPFLDADAPIVAAVRAGQAAGGAALYERHHRHVRRVLMRVLGPNPNVEDLTQDVFLAAIDCIHKLDDPNALRGWLGGIAVFRARREIRDSQRRRLFSLRAPEDLPEQEAVVASPETVAAVRATYHALDRLAADERIAFALRFIDGMELVEAATVCNVSLATFKRRLVRARDKFGRIAARYPELSDWLEGGSRWT